MTAFENWWEQVADKLAERGSRQVAYHAWHAALDTTRGSQAPADDSLAARRLDAHERAIDALSTVQNELLRRLEALESPASYVSVSKEELIAKLERERLASSPDSDPCAGGFCPVELFRPIEETEGSN